MLYDSLLVAAVLMVATAAFLPFTRGEAITLDRFGPLEYVYRAVLLLLIVAFFGWFWTAHGQTTRHACVATQSGARGPCAAEMVRCTQAPRWRERIATCVRTRLLLDLARS